MQQTGLLLPRTTCYKSMDTHPEEYWGKMACKLLFYLNKWGVAQKAWSYGTLPPVRNTRVSYNTIYIFIRLNIKISKSTLSLDKLLINNSKLQQKQTLAYF